MSSEQLRIGVFGLGYVGTVSAACLARGRRRVVGVDPQAVKVDLINAGKPPIVEAGIAELVAEAVEAGRLRATTSAAEAVAATDLSLVCVGTPSRANGSLDTGALETLCEEIGQALRAKSDYHVVVIRSTTLPGTLRGIVQPILERESGKRAGVDFGLCNNPEFLREGTAVADYFGPPKTVIGADDAKAADIVAALYAEIEAPLVVTSVEIGEMVKYADNSWHAVKVTFANEIGSVCQALGIDSHKLMDLVCQDKKLNLSAYYMKPGFAFGGSCLPKDMRALTYKARALDVSVPMLGHVLASNRHQVDRATDMVTGLGKRRVGVLGFSFKAGTDDLRESPMVELIERLIGKGYDLRLFDRRVNLARLLGANKQYIHDMVPHIPTLMVDSVEDVLTFGDVIIIGNNDPDFHDVPRRLRPDQVLVDTVRLPGTGVSTETYRGVNW
ncbi:nucleotide sugar dehydrogenase [Marinivivus vitaminiproducens]|uniref:nucleotide sugar dehydrogenase n=1 Tax=Marinivivus vitaminiproducens TaxID=3035935 RepID=UPI0027A65898|nr:nucleotide sugar dehydrogenase [Geminicoccaceae bacterium SCSIO 64248]